jgi:hypothetical protein
LASHETPISKTQSAVRLRIGVALAAAYTGLAISTLNKLRMTGAGPHFLKLSPRRIVYDTHDLDVWLATKRRISTSDDGRMGIAE